MKQTHHIGYVQTPSVKNLSNVKNALVENGLVPLTTPNEMLPDAIEKSVSELKSQITETFKKIDLSKKKKMLIKPSYNYFYYHSNGIDCYGSYNSSSKLGIWHWNAITGEETQIYSLNYNWRYFFEASNGNLYIGSSVSGSGIVCINGTTAEKIYSDEGWQYFFESSKGYLYVGSTIYGVVCIKGSTVTFVKSGYHWCYFFESSKGDVYASSNTSSSGSTGILHINGTTAEKIYSLNYNWQYFFEDSKGIVYVSTSLNNLGILRINGTTVDKIYEIGGKWCYFFESTKGNVYAGSTMDYGIICINDSSVEQIYSTGGNWQYFYEDNDEFIYVSSAKNGVVCINGSTVTPVYTASYNGQYFTKRSEGLIISQTEHPDGNDFLLIDKNHQCYLMKE